MPSELFVRIVRSEEMSIAVGSKAVVEPQGVGERFASRFVGWSPHKYMVLSLPTVVTVRDHIYDGKKLVIRYMSCDGLVCGFETVVQGAVFTPQRIVLVDYPSKIAVHNIRKGKRVSVFIGGELTFADKSCKCYILDISLDGCQIALDTSHACASLLNIGDGVVVQFVLPGLEPVKYSLSGTLTRALDQKNEACRHFGLKFAAMPDSESKTLESYITDAERFMTSSCSLEK